MQEEVPSQQFASALRALRQQRGLSVNSLAKMSNVSAGMISQIERNRANPSLKILEKLRTALQVPLSALIESETVVQDSPGTEARYVRRADERPIFKVGRAPLVKELLSPLGVEGMQFMVIHMPPRSESEEVIIGPGQKAGLVLKGELVLVVDGQEMVLREGDSFQFESTVSHGIVNRSDEGTDILWIMASFSVIHI